MDDFIEVLCGIYGGRRWIVAADVLAAAPRGVAALRRLGADDLFVLAGSRGTGPVPDDVDAVVLGLTATGVMDAIHGFDRALGELPAEVLEVVDRFDPERRAAVIAPLFTQRSSAARRPVWGARWPSWRTLEDKTVVDRIWRAAGVPQAPSAVIPAVARSLRSAAAALDAGDGTVWVADNRRGWHGGASGVRWVCSDEQAAAAAAFMAERADQVRVMPFLDGVPCSIHGMVLPDATIAFRPCEMVVLRRPGRSELCYAGTASMWDPAAADREVLRDHARRVGEHLRAAVGYRGAFSIDGVMTADGFRPTELNPRYGAALELLAVAADVPLYLVHLAVVEGADVDWRSADLEHLVVSGADGRREARCHLVVDRPLEDVTIDLRGVRDRMVPAAGAPADVTVHCGPSPVGAFVRVALRPDALTPGATVAPLVAGALTWLDEHVGLGLGPLEPASEARVDRGRATRGPA